MIAIPAQAPGICSPATDRALSLDAEAIRVSIKGALAGSDSQDRSAEVYQRVSVALQAASREQDFTSPEAVSRALEILNVLPRWIPLPTVVVESQNAVGLDWDEGRNRVLSLTVDDTPMVGFAAFIEAEPMYGKTPFTGQIPQTLRFLLKRVHGQHTLTY